MTFVVMSGEYIMQTHPTLVGKFVQKMYESGDGPVYFVPYDRDVEPKLAELRREAKTNG